MFVCPRLVIDWKDDNNQKNDATDQGNKEILKFVQTHVESFQKQIVLINYTFKLKFVNKQSVLYNTAMLNIYFGSDRQNVRDAATAYIKKNLPGDGTLTTLDTQSFAPGQIADALGASSLFGGAEWFVLDTPSGNPDFEEETKASLKEMSESLNTFIVLEGALLAPAKKAYAKHTASSEEFAAEKSERFNTFGMAEALAQKDKRKLWVLLQEARLSGLREEEIIGMLWWQLKSLRLAALTNSAVEAGMKDFPYNKSKRALSTFAPGEVVALSHSLIELYHTGHSGLQEMDSALEQWVLTL